MNVAFTVHYPVFGGPGNCALHPAPILGRGRVRTTARMLSGLSDRPERWADEFERAVDAILSGPRVGKGA